MPCDIPGRYTTLVRPGKDRLGIMGVAVFIDCDSPLLPWDQIEGFLAELQLGDQQDFEIPLATKLEEALGADVCGQLEVTFTDLPSFCTPNGNQITCNPSLDAHVGEHEFTVHQVGLEHPNSKRSTVTKIKVSGQQLKTNTPPSFADAFPSKIVIQKTAVSKAWSMKLPEVIDVDDGDKLEVKVFLDSAVLFVKYSATFHSLQISDLSSESVLVGNYTNLKVTLSDSRDS